MEPIMEQEQNYTVEQVIGFTIDMLKGINVPMAHFESVGVPIARSISNLEVCMRSMQQANEKAASENQQSEPAQEEENGNADA